MPGPKPLPDSRSVPTVIPTGPRSAQQVEASRRLLRAILTRRDFLTAAGVGTLSLAGCGGGSGTTTPVVPNPPPSPGTIPTGLQAVTGTVTLPAGSQLNPATMSVDILTQTAPVSASGFTVGITPNGPSLALLLDAGGNGVLMSMFDASLATQAISSHTTAVALLFYATSAYLFPAGTTSQILALLDGDPAMTALAAAVAQAVAADPHALANNAAPLGPAITLAMQTIMGSSLHTSTARAAPARLATAVPTLITLNSIAEQNGIVVSLDFAAITALLSNVKRRPCRVYVYEITTQVTGAAAIDIVPAKYIAGPLELIPTESLSLSHALHDFFTFFSGASPWSPVNLPPIPLALESGTDLTRYNVIVVAAALKSLAYDTWEPTFYRDAHYKDTAVATWRADSDTLLRQVVFCDILLPTVSFILGYGMISAARASVAAVVAAASGVEKATMDTIINTLQYGSMGDLKEALVTIVQNAYTSQLYTGSWTKEVKAVMDPARAQAIAAGEAAGTQATRATAASRMFLKLFSPLLAAGAALSAIDFCAVIFDLWNSDIATSWEILLIHQKLGLVPQSPRIPPGGRAHLSVSPPANIPAGSFQYDWTQNSLLGYLSAVGEANVGPSITTSKLAVDLQAIGSDVTPINVTVIGYDTRSGQRVEFGRDGTTVNFLYPAEILPSGAVLDKNEQRTYSVTVTGALPQGVQYKWTLTGTSGSIGTSNVVITTVPTINYIAAVPGTDSLHVDVLDAAGTLYAQADAPITVAAAASIQFTVAGAWDPTKTPPNGHYGYTDFNGGRAPYPYGVGLDGLFFEYDIAPDQTIGVMVGIFVATGEAFGEGETFSHVAGGGLAAGQWNLLLALDLNNPNYQEYPAGTGTCKIDSLGQLLDGTWVANYSFTITNGGSGMITGSGVGRWK